MHGQRRRAGLDFGDPPAGLIAELQRAKVFRETQLSALISDYREEWNKAAPPRGRGAPEEVRRADAAGPHRGRIRPAAYREASPRIGADPVDPLEWIMFSSTTLTSGADLWLLSLESGTRAVPFIAAPGQDLHGNFSPTRDLVAYSSNESGRFDVYVETIPRSDRKWTVSTIGGYEPRWRADRRELYYLSEDQTLMAVEVGDGPSFGVPKPLVQTHMTRGVSSNRTHYVPNP